MNKPNEDIEIKDSLSSNDTSVIEIKAEGGSWIDFLSTLIIGMALMYGAMVVASYVGLNIPGVTTQIVKEVIREIPKEVEKPVSVPVLPQQIWIDTPGNIPGCFPIFIHIRYGNGELRSYRFDICGRW